MNYLEQINWFWDKVREVEIKPSSRLLYLAILQIWNETRWKAQLKVPRDSAMYLAGIGSTHTYYASLQELADKGFIKYEKGNNQHSAATIEVVVSSSKSASPPASAGASPSATPTAQATASPTASIDKQETSKQETVNNNPPISPTPLTDEKKEQTLKKVSAAGRQLSDVVWPFESEEFHTAWELWMAYRREKKYKAYGAIGLQAALRKLSNDAHGNEQTAIEMINHAIASSWQGIFPIKDNSHNGTKAGNRHRVTDAELAAAIKEGLAKPGYRSYPS